MTDAEKSPWLCHVCGRRFLVGEAEACSLCYKTACSLHLKKRPVTSAAGILVLEPICTHCELARTV